MMMQGKQRGTKEPQSKLAPKFRKPMSLVPRPFPFTLMHYGSLRETQFTKSTILLKVRRKKPKSCFLIGTIQCQKKS